MIFQMHSPEKYQFKPKVNRFKSFNPLPAKAASHSSHYTKAHLSYSLNFYPVPHQLKRSPCRKGLSSDSIS